MIAARGAAALAFVLEPMAHKARSRRAKMPNFGNQLRRELLRETKPGGPADILAELFGEG